MSGGAGRNGGQRCLGFPFPESTPPRINHSVLTAKVNSGPREGRGPNGDPVTSSGSSFQSPTRRTLGCCGRGRAVWWKSPTSAPGTPPVSCTGSAGADVGSAQLSLGHRERRNESARRDRCHAPQNRTVRFAAGDRPMRTFARDVAERFSENVVRRRLDANLSQEALGLRAALHRRSVCWSAEPGCPSSTPS